MLIKYLHLNSSRNRLGFLVLLVLSNLILCLTRITDWAPLSADQIWFYNTAKESLFHGGFPLVYGLRSSIYWLHHGAFWLYVLIPALPITNFHPLTASFLTVFLNLFNIPLVYYFSGLLFGKKQAVISAFLVSFFNYSIVLSRLGNHISLIPLLWLIFALALVKKRYFLSGLFLGFLYQTHLFAFVYWPVAILYLLYKKAPLSGFITGSVIGIIPFIITGPIQTFGIVVWLMKYLLTLRNFSGASNSQMLIFLIPAMVVVSVLLSRLEKRFLAILGVIYLVFNVHYLISRNFTPWSIFYSINYGQKLRISRQILQQSRLSSPEIIVPGGLPDASNSYSEPYKYLVWWLQRRGGKPEGTYSKFVVDENKLSVKVLE